MARTNLENAMRRCAVLLFILTFVQMCRASGQIEFKIMRYQSSCTDNWILREQCDTFFYICIDRPGSVNMNSCDYGKFGPSSYYRNTNNINDFGNNVGGITNPMRVSTSRFDSNDVMFVVQSWDYESVNKHEHLATLSKVVTYPPARDVSEAAWLNGYMFTGSYHVWFAYRSYCDAYYHTRNCDVYCRPRDDVDGHYSCDPDTGLKKCITGWTGSNCQIDVNECDTGICYNNAKCVNLPGSYQCACPSGFTGQKCGLIDSLCHSSPCRNNGTCNGTMTSFNCTCSIEWTGVTCENQVDFCKVNPCKNNGTCYGKVGNYTCVCDGGWTGYHCDTEINACDVMPCQNGGTCLKQAGGLYSCACSEQYEGKNCSELKNPCDPNPCTNSGSCMNVTYDEFNCTCVYGWTGHNCSDYIVFEDPSPPTSTPFSTVVIGNSQPQESNGEVVVTGESPNVLAIVLATLAVLVIAIVILTLILIRRHRRKLKEQQMASFEEQLNSPVIQVQDGNVAFRNALYDQMNRANSYIDRSNRQREPVPPPPSEDVFNPVKPPNCVDANDARGAIGDAANNPYAYIDEYSKPVHCRMEKAGVQTQAHTGDCGTGYMTMPCDVVSVGESKVNHYADFDELKRQSLARRQHFAESDDSCADATVDELDEVERIEDVKDHHYQDLDEVYLEIQTSLKQPVSHYDVPPVRNNYLLPIQEPATDDSLIPSMDSVLRQLEENDLDETDASEEESFHQEDIDRLRQEVLDKSLAQSFA